MSNTVITNYTDLNGPSTKADSSVVVIVNKDGSLSVDQKLLGTLMGTDGSQGAISVVRVGHEGKPDDATDSETDDDKIPHVTLSVDSYYDEPNSIIKYDSGAEMLQSLRIETREKSLVGFHNDHCYTPLTSPNQILPQRSDSNATYEEPMIEIVHNQLLPSPKPIPNSKKITILEQQILPKGRKIILTPSESPIILKGNNVLNKTLPVLTKTKDVKDVDKSEAFQKTDDNSDSTSISSSGDSVPDRDSDSDYRDTKDRAVSGRVKKAKLKPRILKSAQPSKVTKSDLKLMPKFKSNKNIMRRENRDKILNKNISEKKDIELDLESILPTTKIAVNSPNIDISKNNVRLQTTKPAKKEKKTPAHVTALLSDMSSLFSTPDVIRRVSTDTKIPSKSEKEPLPNEKKPQTPKLIEISNNKIDTAVKSADTTEKPKAVIAPKTYLKSKAITPTDKTSKGFDLIPQIDDMSLAQILQDTTGIPTNAIKQSISTSGTMNSPGLAGPLSPTLDLLGGLQPEEEGLTEDLLMHVAQLVESSENLQEVIDKQVLGKVDSDSTKSQLQSSFQQVSSSLYTQNSSKSVKNIATPRKDPIEIVRRDGRVITLPPIEAPATRSSKRKSQMVSPSHTEIVTPVTSRPVAQIEDTIPEPLVHVVSKQYVNKKLSNKKTDQVIQNVPEDKISAESQESWNSEDDPYRLWCICKQPHNNRFMICCDGCEDWFHGKCVNITKAMGQQMEEQGIEWRCPNCIKKAKLPSKTIPKMVLHSKKNENEEVVQGTLTPAVKDSSKTSCIVCKKPARASSIYCSDSCILKHAQDSLGNQGSFSKADSEPGKPQEKHKMESRVIVYERKSGRLLAGPNAPTAENLKSWLQQNPTFEVVRPGTLSTTKPNASKRKTSHEPHKIQTTLNFERIPKKISDQSTPTRTQTEVRERTIKVLPNTKDEPIPTPQPKTPITPQPKTPVTPQPKTPVKPKSQSLIFDTPKASTSSAKMVNEPRKIIRASTSRSSLHDKAPAVSPSTSRRKDTPDSRNRMNSAEPIRDNVRKALQEQIANRMSEESGFKFSEDEIHQFAYDTEFELHELFRDVGMKYKAKYRSLMFNIKDRKNLSLWDKICSREITPKQLVRLSPEDLASQELAQWRDKEAKHQLELIKKSELDLLAASKTYVLKTHKGEEVMETKTSVQTELDPNVPVENLVKALNDSTVGEMVSNEITPESTQSKSDIPNKKHSSKKRAREEGNSNHSRKSKRNSKRDSDTGKSRSSRRKSELKEKESKDEEHTRSTRRSDKRSSRAKSASKDTSKGSKEKSDSSERYRHRSPSQSRSKRRSKSGEYSRSASKGRERSRSRARLRRRSDSREISKQRRRSRSKQTRRSTDETHITRSRSQENVYTKNKNDSTDSDSIERPKSAMLKDTHPEYDPHEPMITSAFSEEDLRKSREDMFEESYKNDIGEYNAEYDPAKSFSINSNVILPSTTTHETKQDKASEPESDQEPTSTVDNSAATVWNGCINMVDVARFYVAAHEVSGSATDLEEDLSTELDIVGRINPETVWEYISKMKKASNKDIVILKLQAANDEEKMQYIALYSYLSSRNRLGVVKVSSTTTVKDFYIVPVPANTALQQVLLPLDGPGLGEVKTHLLIAIVIRLRKKRLPPNIPKDIIPAKVARESRKRSYTPPIISKSTHSPPASPKRRVPLPLPSYTSPALSTSVKDKIAATLASADDEEAYSPGSSSSSASIPAVGSASAPPSNTLRTKMEELNRQIEEQKQQILKMAQADSSVGEDEAYSPSRPMTPPTVGTLADIALPSNLQEILATIKQRTETSSADVDMRTMPLP